MGIKHTINRLNKQWGGDKIYTFNQQNHMRFSFNYIPTGIASLDLSLMGGIKQGSTSMIAGLENSAKTTLCLHIAKQALIKFPDKYVIFVDTENLIDPEWVCKIIGEELYAEERLLLVKPDCSEQASDSIDQFMRESQVSLIVVDSIAAFTTLKEIENAADKETMALRAKSISKLCSKINCLELWAGNDDEKFAPTTLFTNQITSSFSMYGSPHNLTSGHKVRYKSITTIWVKLSKSHTMKNPETGIENPWYNEHEFSFKKEKNTFMPSGSFNLIRDPDHPLGAGAIEQGDDIYSFCSKMGMIKNKGIEGIREGIGLKADIIRELNNDQEFSSLVVHHLIRKARVSKQMRELPPDKYLVIKAPKKVKKEVTNEENIEPDKDAKQEPSVPAKPRTRRKPSK
jgi:RecA/RadA recombinase